MAPPTDAQTGARPSGNVRPGRSRPHQARQTPPAKKALSLRARLREEGHTDCDCGDPEHHHPAEFTPLSLGEGLGVRFEKPGREVALAADGIGYENGVPFGMDKIIERAIKRLYDRKIEAGHPDPELWKANAEAVWQAVQQGYNTPVNKMEFGSRQHALALQMRYNTATTMAFKLHHNSLEMGRELFNPDGTIRTFAEFKKAVQPIARDYNKNWLKTEWRTAKGMAQAADNWVRLTSRPGKLKYNTQQDGNVREAHALLQGMIKPKDWPGWKTYAPKNDWNCRCWLTSVPEDTDDVNASAFPEIKKMFRINPGITGEVFGKGTPYFEILASFGALAAADFGLPLVSKKLLKRRLKQYRRLENNKGYVQKRVDNQTGASLFHAVGVDGERDFAQNAEAAHILATNGYAVAVRKTDSRAVGIKQWDYILDGRRAELKTIHAGTQNNIGNAIRKGSDQAPVVVLHLSKLVVDALARQLKGSFMTHKNLQRVILIYKGRVLSLDRKTCLAGLHRQFIKNLGD